jgi:hypothetical protein
VYDVTGTINHTPNVNSVTDLKLFINDTQEGLAQDPTGNGTSAAFSLPWNILVPGVYDVKVTAKHGNDIGEDVQEDIVFIETQVVVTECPAAPAIAAGYMKSLSIKEGSSVWKKVMKGIAQQTGVNGGLLWAANSCAAGYSNNVKSAVDVLRN